jgi:hypothetical protein
LADAQRAAGVASTPVVIELALRILVEAAARKRLAALHGAIPAAVNAGSSEEAAKTSAPSIESAARSVDEVGAEVRDTTGENHRLPLIERVLMRRPQRPVQLDDELQHDLALAALEELFGEAHVRAERAQLG